jgi:hypothetical protein
MLTGFAFSSPLIVVFYHWGGRKSEGTLGWSESERNVVGRVASPKVKGVGRRGREVVVEHPKRRGGLV